LSERVTRLRAADFDEAIAFLEMVFSDRGPRDFANMLPSIYRPTDEHMSHNYAIKEAGRIRAIVGMFPMDWHVAGRRLRVAGIGGVSTHPESRRRGYFRALMRHCVDRAREEGCHVSWLGGQRQRYRYFGYEKCGFGYRFTFDRPSLRHTFSGEPIVRFEPLEGDERVRRAKELHDRQLVHGERSLDDFPRHLRSWHNAPYAAIGEGGRLVGYLVARNKGDYVTELVAESDDVGLEMVHGWGKHIEEGEMSMEAPSWNPRFCRLLARHCAQLSVVSTGNWNIIDWVAATHALMKVRQSMGHLEDGVATVEVEGHGAIRLQVTGGEATCVAAQDRSDVVCDGPTAMRLLFGPLPPGAVLDLPREAGVLESWCPLPLTWSKQDGV